jgi:transcriptional regulator with XRE-family HTH domain
VCVTSCVWRWRGRAAKIRRPLADPADIFARNLRRAREKSGLSQEALADKADMHRNEISLLERGQREPKIGTVARLAKALGVKSSDLLKGL